MARRSRGKDRRSFEQIKEHYEVERELADQLRNASEEERKRLYSPLYDELFRRVPHHPMLVRKHDPDAQARSVRGQAHLLSRFLTPDSTYLELGPGDCSLAFEVAKSVKQVYAVDVSAEITKSSTFPGNAKLIISDGTSIAVGENSVDLVYSNQLMEHVHPDDALLQLRNVYKALTVHGAYICVTPNRLSGPHDISKYFDDVARGFHLKEYTNTELSRIFKDVGFSKLFALVGGRSFFLRVPVLPITWLEGLLSVVPRRLRLAVSSRLPMRLLLGIRLLAIK